MKKNFLVILFFASTSTLSAQNVFPTPSGNVGIGTSSPAERLHVYRNQSGYYNPLVVIEDGISNGYTQFAMKGTGRQYHLGVGNATETGFGLANKFYIWDQNAVAPRFTIDASGNIGIGTTSPSAQLHTSGSVRFAGLTLNNTYTRIMATDANGNISYRDASTLGGTSGWALDGSTVGALKKFGTTDNYALPLITNNVERMRIGTNGNIGIGTTAISDPAYKLFVETGIRTRKIKVDQLTWADYVFQPSYKLMPLDEVEKYINLHQHLPGVPTALEVEQEGLDLGNNQATLLKKIEELTLYIIELKKQNDGQDKQIKELLQSLTK